MCQVIAILPESEASDLKHNRFHNKYGGKGKNIPFDLLEEQLNKDLKTMWKALGTNLSDRSSSRIANALEMQMAILTSIDHDCAIEKRKGYRAAKKPRRECKTNYWRFVRKKCF